MNRKSSYGAAMSFPTIRSPKPTKRTATERSSERFERTVVYRGIKIPPISGQRSATARAIRDALWAKFNPLPSKQPHN
jgi:hypothetical protein